MALVGDLVLILFIAMVFGFVAYKVKFPLVVGYLIGGAGASWFLADFVHIGEVESVAAIGLALLMFTLGLEFSLKRLRSLGEIIILGSLLQIILTIICGIFFFPFFGYDLYNSFFLGAVFSLSSTAVVVKILTDRGEIDSLHGEIAVGWLLVQDLATLPLIVLLPAIGGAMQSGGTLLWSFLSVARAMAVSIFGLIVILLLGRKIIPFLIEKVAQTKIRELLLLSVVLICLAFAYVSNNVGFSFALGAFLGGMVIASTAANHAVFSEVRPLRDIFSIIFFVSLGFLLDPNFLWQNLPLILFLTVMLILGKFLLSSLLVLVLGYHTRVAFFVGVMLTSVGEFAFILGQIGKTQGLIGNETYMLILSITMMSLIISSPLIVGMERIYRIVRGILKRYFTFLVPIFKSFDEQKLDKTLTYSEHAVVLGHGRVGKYISHALFSSGIEYVVVDYNNHIIKNLRKSGIAVIYGDPSEIDVLKAANVDKAKVVVIAIPDRFATEVIISHCLSLNPNIIIICRTHHEEDQNKLKELGVEVLIQPEFEAALSITGKLLKLYNLNLPYIEDRIATLKKEHGF